LFGQPLDVPSLTRFAEERKLIVVEDAAQALGVLFGDGRPAGSVGVCSVFSFGRGKIADAGGGAAVLSDDADLLSRVRAELAAMPSGSQNLAEHATQILHALNGLPAELESRSALAHAYRRTLQSSRITHPSFQSRPPLWKYSLLLPNRSERDHITRALLANRVEATNLYPPLPQFFPETRISSPQAYPAAHDVYERIINLPLRSPSQKDLLRGVENALATHTA
jgi:dTDP-4-amino-4,6-dideoxygalactose transaminase